MSEAAIEALAIAIRDEYRSKIICVEKVELARRRKSPVGQIYHWYFWRRWQVAADAALTLRQ